MFLRRQQAEVEPSGELVLLNEISPDNFHIFNRIGVDAHVNAIFPCPKIRNVVVTIPIDESIKPVIQPYRRIPIPLESRVNKKIKELVESDIIEPVPSKWISSMVPVLKAHGDICICIDMRRANMAILWENHSLPTMEQIIPSFREVKLFSRLGSG